MFKNFEQKKSLIFILCLGIFLPLVISAGVISAASLPSVLTHDAANLTQSAAMLNGELANTGNVSSVSVWFEYGLTANYGFQTNQQTITQPGTFYANISGLNSCANYHFRALASNEAGTAYGQDRNFTTQCPAGSVDIKANGSQGPITIGYNQSAALSWTSGNVSACQASGAWSGNKATSGSESTGSLTASRTYTLTCVSSGGTVSDSVIVNVSSQPSLSVILEAVPPSGASPLNNVDLRATVSGEATGEIRYQFDCQDNGVWEKDITISSTPFSPYIAQNLCNYFTAGSYTARVRVSRAGLTAENTAMVSVSQFNLSPVVQAGSDLQVYEGETATLQGSGSDPDGGSVSYSWSCNAGTLNSYNISQPIYTAPSVSSDTTYTCTLTVLDDEGLTSSDSVNIRVLNRQNYSSPEVETRSATNISNNQATLQGYLRNVGGSGSTRVWFQWGYNANYGNTTNWQYLSGPSDFNFTISNLSSDTAYYFRAAAQNDQGTVYGNNFIFSTSRTNANYPIAQAGPDKQVYEGETVVLQGSGYDPDNDPLTYSWSCNAGTLNSYNIAQPTFTAPQIITGTSYNYICTLTVRDNYGLSSSDSVNIAVLKGQSASQASVRINVTAQNLTKNDGVVSEYLSAVPSDELLFKITVEGLGPGTARNLYLKNTLPSNIIYLGDLRINNSLDNRNINNQAILLGDLSQGASQVITFRARVQADNYFNYGTSNLVNSALIYNEQLALTDTCTVAVVRKAVAGATTVNTGAVDSLFNSLLLPFAVAFTLVWLFKAQILGFDRWAEQRKAMLDEYRAKKQLQILTAKLKDKF